MTIPVLEVQHLTTRLPADNGSFAAVDDVSISVEPAGMTGVVGESGCGKTMLSLSIMGLLPDGAQIVSGRILVAGEDVAAMGPPAVRSLQGTALAMSFQNPVTALNPVMKVRSQVQEAMTAHGASRAEAAKRVVPLLSRANLPSAGLRAELYPHQLSVGMCQRVMLAIGIANQPSLLIADEPTTALDTIAQAQVMDLLERLNRDLEMAVLLVTHNMGLVARLCQRVVVMYAGRVVEEGPAERVFGQPQHPYTWYLLRSVPTITGPRPSRLATIGGSPPDLRHPPGGCRFHPRCGFAEERCRREEPPLRPVAPGQQARCWVLMDNAGGTQRVAAQALTASPSTAPPYSPSSSPGGPEPILRLDQVRKQFRSGGGQLVRAVDGVTLQLRRGESLGIIGESGCGKSTLARLIAGLMPVDSGRILFEGLDLAQAGRRALRDIRRSLQMVFQDPLGSVDPRMKVIDLVGEPLDNFRLARGRAREQRVSELLALVGLAPDCCSRLPHEFSGGELQRIGIARALALEPSLVILDEPVSALDVSIQAQIINLLQQLRERLHLSYLFISHDLAVIRSIADRVAVMYLGRIVEVASAEDIYRDARHPYTRALLDAAPPPDPAKERRRRPIVLEGELPSAADPPPGCHFHPRCPIAQVPGMCAELSPSLAPVGSAAHRCACHFADSSPGALSLYD